MWFLISLANLALCIWSYLKTSNRLIDFTGIPDGAAQRPPQMPQATGIWFLDLYAKVFRTQNLASVFSIMSEMMYRSVYMSIQGLNKLGLRREITIDPFPPDPNASQGGIIIAGNKIQSSACQVRCNYKEQYIDTTTNAVLYEDDKPQTSVNLGVMRSAKRAAGQAGVTYCLNCGAEVDTSGEMYVCRHCGTTYRADSYDWVVMNVQVNALQELSNSTTMKVLKFYGYSWVIVIPLTLILSLFAGGNLTVRGMVLLLNAAFLALTLWARKAATDVYHGIIPMREFDPLVSDAALGERIAYLVRRAYYSHDFDLHDIRPLMDPAAYQQWLAGQDGNGNRVLDIRGWHLMDKSSFYVRDNRQYFDCGFECTLLALTPQRQIIKVPKKFRVIMYRNEGTRYEQTLEAQSTSCAGCGSSVDLTVNGNCKYCGMEYDVADFDWKLASIDPKAFT